MALFFVVVQHISIFLYRTKCENFNVIHGGTFIS